MSTKVGALGRSSCKIEENVDGVRDLFSFKVGIMRLADDGKMSKR